MAEQTMVALLWQQGDARGTLDLPAATKVEDLKLCLNASDCAAVMFDTVIIEVRKGGSVLKRKLDTQEQDAVVDPSWTSSPSRPPRSLRPSLSRRCASTPSLLWCILGSQGAKHAALARCGVAGKPC